MKEINTQNIHPRKIADKSDKKNLTAAIKMALSVESEALKINTRSFNANRYKATSKIDDYTELKKNAREIKERSIANLPQLIKKLKLAVESNNGSFFLAETAAEANRYILNVLKKKSVRQIVKAKSITTEEIGLNSVLENNDIEIAETDLAEFILQISKEQPSHNVAPAIHRSRERITKLFKQHFNTDLELSTGEELTIFARDILREKFLTADVGISGANLIDAETGSILLVESEGNIRLSTQIPPIHIAVSGIEKIVPDKKSFAPFIELLASSGTGQPLTSYTNIIKSPNKITPFNFSGKNEIQREFHLVLVDNGRMRLRDDDQLKEALYCIRCSACMNVCANFQSVGGHAFGGEFYTGGIGGAWTAATQNLSKARFAELCTGCSRCIPNCPVEIDIPYLNTVLKERLLSLEKTDKFQKYMFGSFAGISELASVIPNIYNWIIKKNTVKKWMEKTIGFENRRPVPKLAEHTLAELYKDYSLKKQNPESPNKIEAVLLADVFTNFNNPEVGISLISLFEKLGVKLSLTKVKPDGRSYVSQGLINKAKAEAEKLNGYLSGFTDRNIPVIVAEPSVLAMLRHDYQKLIDKKSYEALAGNSYDPFEYIVKNLNPNIYSNLKNYPNNIETDKSIVFYHGHCQLKSIGADLYTVDFFRKLGYNVFTSDSECCGMAGSFGYKKDFYELSKDIGMDLIAQIDSCRKQCTAEVFHVLASGTSCREQINDLSNFNAVHPIIFADRLFNDGK